MGGGVITAASISTRVGGQPKTTQVMGMEKGNREEENNSLPYKGGQGILQRGSKRPGSECRMLWGHLGGLPFKKKRMRQKKCQVREAGAQHNATAHPGGRCHLRVDQKGSRPIGKFNNKKKGKFLGGKRDVWLGGLKCQKSRTKNREWAPGGVTWRKRGTKNGRNRLSFSTGSGRALPGEITSLKCCKMQILAKPAKRRECMQQGKLERKKKECFGGRLGVKG